MQTQRLVLASLALGSALLAFECAEAQSTYPSRPISMIVPFAAGGPTDTLARIMAQHLNVSLGQPVVIENVTGAAGAIAVGRVARAAPDGYTLGIGNWGTHVINGAVMALQYDLLKDFEPVALIASNPLLIVTKNGVPAKELTGLIAWLKANGDKASAGTSGAGAPSHIAGVLFQRQTGHELSVRAVSRRRPSFAGPDGGTDRPDVRPSVELRPACAERQDQGLCGCCQDPLDCSGGHSNGGRSRVA